MPAKLNTQDIEIYLAVSPRSSSLSSPARDSKVLVSMSKDIMAHLYSHNVHYQKRILNSYYHPRRSTFKDPFMVVKGREAIRTLYAFILGWLAKEVSDSVNGITTSNGYFTVDEEPRQGATIMVDHTVKITQFTPLGNFLHFFGLLYPFTYLSGTRGGWRVISQLHWVADDSHENGFILQHEDVYSASAPWPMLWILSIVQLAFSALLWLGDYLISFDPVKTKQPPSNVQVTFGWVVTLVLSQLGHHSRN